MADPNAPAGAVLAHTQWGEPKTDTRAAAAPEGSQPNPWGVPYKPPPRDTSRDKKCKAKDNTCNGWKVTGSDFCAGHAGLMPAGGKR